MAITLNRKVLKELADFNIDSSFVQRFGNQIFSFSGETTDDYKNLCQDLSVTIKDCIAELQEILKEIPIFDTTDVPELVNVKKNIIDKDSAN